MSKTTAAAQYQYYQYYQYQALQLISSAVPLFGPPQEIPHSLREEEISEWLHGGSCTQDLHAYNDWIQIRSCMHHA